jgi:hypothetical protein
MKVSGLLEIDGNHSLKLPYSLYLPNLNFYTFALYTQYRTEKLNNQYRVLIPSKIEKLRETKNLLLQFKDNYIEHIKQTENTDFYKTHIDFKNDFPKEYKINLADGFFKPLTEKEKETINLIFPFGFHIKGIDETIEQIKKSIKHYQQELKVIQENNRLNTIREKYGIKDLVIPCLPVLFSERLNNNDILALKNKDKPTDNIKALYYFYLIKLKKIVVKSKTKEYLNESFLISSFNNDALIRKETTPKAIINHYCEQEIINDFPTLIKSELNTFQDWFINKTL